MIVKICGLQEVEDVKATVAAGADMIGFVFAESSRQITCQQAKRLAKEIPPVIQKVGVFVNPTLAEVERVAREVPLELIQLHGQESGNFVNQISLPVIKALPIETGEEISLIGEYCSETMFLMDAPVQSFAGGSGQPFNWQLVERSRLVKDKLLIAGGLTAATVQAAIAYFQPMGVDVSSGVETNGKKDVAKIQQFIRMAKGEK